MGNVKSVQRGFERAGFPARISGDPREVAEATHLVVPGDGAFADCMENLERHRLIDPIVGGIREGKPYLGICLGLQILFTSSEEFGGGRGLDLIKGRVVRFALSPPWKVPHMGWNDVEVASRAPIFEGVPDRSYFYFVHSYYPIPEDLSAVIGFTEHGSTRFVSALQVGNVVAFQFHPEKSQAVGCRLLENFVRMR